jgi:HEAT repeat protein
MNDAAPDPSGPWLRETVDSELEDLFVDSGKTVQRAVQRILDQLVYNSELETLLVDTLQLSLEQCHDDTQGTLWIALILGEAGSSRAIAPLIAALGAEDDEELQQVAKLALLKSGPPAIESLIEFLDHEEPAPALATAAYDLLGYVGALEDPGLTARAADHLRERLELEPPRERPEAVEACALALARLGDQEAASAIAAIAREHFDDANAALADALEMLGERSPGEVPGDTRLPGADDYEWLFAYAPRRTRERLSAEQKEDATSGEETDTLYRGLGSGDGRDPADERRDLT